MSRRILLAASLVLALAPAAHAQRTNKEGADFKPPATIQAWRDRSRAVREQLLVTLGLWPMPPKTPLHPEVFGKVERDGYTIEKVVLETLPGFTLSGNLYRPTGGEGGKVPGILSPHGHAREGRVQPDAQARAVRWAKLGCVVFAYDMVGYNDSEPFDHKFLNARLRRWGLSLATLQTWDSIRALDWLTSLPDVDAARIGCTGESGGGTQTFLLTAIDDRIKVAAPVVMVSDSFQGGCSCENAAGLRLGTDNVEFAALAAPRPLKLVGATGDWTKLTMTHAYPTLQAVYKLAGSPDRVSADVFDFPHNYNQTSRNAVYAFMAKWLLDLDDPEKTREGAQTIETPADLLTYGPDHPRPAGLKDASQLEDALVEGLGKQVETLAPSKNGAAWQAAREFLEVSHRVRLNLVNPPPAEIETRETNCPDLRGARVVLARVGRRGSDESIAVYRLTPAHPDGRLTVVFAAKGLDELIPGSDAVSLANALLHLGQSVALFVQAPAKSPSPEIVHFDTYNPTLPAVRAQELATVLAWARSRPGVRVVNLVATGETGPLALLARPALEGLGRTAIDLDGFHYGDGSEEMPAWLDLPGVLQIGDLKAAAALTAPAPLRIARPGAAFARQWAERAYALDGASDALQIDDGEWKPEELARWIDGR